MPANLATKAHIEDLKMELMRLRDQMQAVAIKVQLPAPASRYLVTRGCATYIGRSVEGVRRLVERRQIPFSKIAASCTSIASELSRGCRDMPIAAMV
jgi:hypothetical protein